MIFIIPYMFVYNNALLLVGSISQILMVCVTAFLGVLALSFAAQNYLGGKMPWWVRILMFIGAALLIYPGWPSDIVGMVILAALYLARRRQAVGGLPFLGNRRTSPETVIGNK